MPKAFVRFFGDIIMAEKLPPKLRRLIDTITELYRLPRVKICLSGKFAPVAYKYFMKPHPRYFIFRNKCLGVGLIPLPATFEEFLRGRDKQAFRTNRNRCLSKGFTCSQVDYRQYLDDMLEINCSLHSRQNKIMDHSYLEKQTIIEYFGKETQIHAVINADGKLRAYAHTHALGDLVSITRLLGHGDDLNDGVMYLLISEIVHNAIFGMDGEYDRPSWLMYDTFFGATPGLRYFKERLGFKPYVVKWVRKSDR